MIRKVNTKQQKDTVLHQFSKSPAPFFFLNKFISYYLLKHLSLWPKKLPVDILPETHWKVTIMDYVPRGRKYLLYHSFPSLLTELLLLLTCPFTNKEATGKPYNSLSIKFPISKMGTITLTSVGEKNFFSTIKSIFDYSKN